MDHERSPDRRNLARGRAGEETAAAWYRRHGYTIVARNWRNESGEIDLLCRRGRILVVCEVKARRTDRLGAPLEAVTAGKQHRLHRLAAAYLQTTPDGYDEIRFDVASLLGNSLTVVEGAF